WGAAPAASAFEAAKAAAHRRAMPASRRREVKATGEAPKEMRVIRMGATLPINAPLRQACSAARDRMTGLAASRWHASDPRSNGTGGVTNGISATRQFGSQGLGADDGHDDDRRQGKLRQGRRRLARRG